MHTGRGNGGKRQRGVSNFLAKPVGENKAISQGDAFPVHLVKFDTTGLIILISYTIKQQSNTVSVSLWETQRGASQPRGCGRAWKQPAGRCHWLSSVIHHYTKPAAGGLLPTNGCLTNEYACVLLGKKKRCSLQHRTMPRSIIQENQTPVTRSQFPTNKPRR